MSQKNTVTHVQHKMQGKDLSTLREQYTLLWIKFIDRMEQRRG